MKNIIFAVLFVFGFAGFANANEISEAISKEIKYPFASTIRGETGIVTVKIDNSNVTIVNPSRFARLNREVYRAATVVAKENNFSNATTEVEFILN